MIKDTSVPLLRAKPRKFIVSDNFDKGMKPSPDGVPLDQRGTPKHTPLDRGTAGYPAISCILTKES